ncbi:MAG: DUF3592 domain-containing protein [Kiritimatiellae bacterium]|nr:DUF3592 domain-containing protein [Kiritimatiellia bacterium]
MQKEEKGLEVGRLLVGCLFLTFVSFFAWTVGRDIFPPTLDGYASVPCRIEQSKVVREKLDRFVLTVTFSYKYGNHTYTSRSLCRPGRYEFVFDRLGDRLPLLEKYAPGKSQTCRVDPKNPSDGVLVVEAYFKDGGGSSGQVMRVLPFTVLALFLGAGVFLIASSLPFARRLATPRFRKLLLAAMLILFSLPFTVIGTLGIRSALHDRGETGNYVPVPAKVLYAGIRSHRSGGRHPSTTYSVRVGYEYVLNGHTYESDKYSAVEISTSGYESHRRKAERYKAGDKVTAYVSPTDPRKSVLVRSGTLDEWFPVLAMGLFGVIGLVVMACGIRIFFSSFARTEESRSFDGFPLKCSRGDLAGLGFFALFWNLVTWSMLGGFYVGGIFQNFEPVFLVFALFSIFGIGILVAFFRKLVTDLKAPKLTMSLSCAMWTPGSGAQIDWKLERAEEVESLEIVLEGARWTGGKHRYKTVVSTTSCCRHENQVIPSGWRFGFSAPEALDGVKWSFIATMKVKGVQRPYTLTYVLPVF